MRAAQRRRVGFRVCAMLRTTTCWATVRDTHKLALVSASSPMNSERARFLLSRLRSPYAIRSILLRVAPYLTRRHLLGALQACGDTSLVVDHRMVEFLAAVFGADIMPSILKFPLHKNVDVCEVFRSCLESFSGYGSVWWPDSEFAKRLQPTITKCEQILKRSIISQLETPRPPCGSLQPDGYVAP